MLISGDDDVLPREGEGQDASVVRRAHKRFKRWQQFNAQANERWADDYRFANGDAYNNYQWPNGISSTRGDRPSLTVNETRQHNLHIRNEAKQNKTEVKYRPTGDDATAEAAEVMEGIYRHIANISNAQRVQGKAIDFQVDAGQGFTRVLARYADTKTFNQEIYISEVSDPRACWLDPDGNPVDGSDCRYGGVFADRPRDEVETEFPQMKGKTPPNAVDGEDGGWIREDHIRVCEYYEISEEKDELIGDADGNIIVRSDVTPSLLKKWEAEAEAKGEPLRRREIVKKRVHWYKIVGDEIVDDELVPGSSVPIIPWVGEVTVIDGRIDRKGHTRAMIGAQQMLNYNWSASVEFGALQAKSPWLAPASAIEGYGTYWETANTENHSVLPYNHRDDEGRDIPPPQRQDPPSAAPVYIEGAQMAAQFMQSASGQHEAEMGQQGNERSGKAINERQRQSDRATYHFVDNQALSVRRQGQIILEWVPHIYDTARVLKIIGEDGEETQVQVDPTADAAHQSAVQGAMAVFNPNVGTYEVVSDVGPDYATQRQEAFNAIIQILTQAPQLIDRIGDLLFKVADFPLAEQIAERLKPGLPPEAQQAITALQDQLQKKNKLLGDTMQLLSEQSLKIKQRDSSSEVNEFKADTDRAKMLLDAATKVDPAAAMEMIREMAQQAVRQAMQDNLGPVRLVNDSGLQSEGNPASGGPNGTAVPHVPGIAQSAGVTSDPVNG